MKKELIIKVVIVNDQIGAVVSRSGFPDTLSSSFEIVGVLQKLVKDEQEKLDKKLKTQQSFTVKEPINQDGI
jgi:hypothetical protein